MNEVDMKILYLIVAFLFSFCTVSHGGEYDGQKLKQAIKSSVQPDDQMLKTWAIIHCQDQVFKYSGTGKDRTNWAIDLAYSFDGNKELNELFNSCIEVQFAEFKRDFQ